MVARSTDDLSHFEVRVMLDESTTRTSSDDVAEHVGTLWLPNEDFGRMNKRYNADVRSTFQWFMAQIEKCFLRKSSFHRFFLLPKSSFGWGKLYGYDAMRIFEALCKGVSTPICAKNNGKVNRTSAFHRLFILPNRPTRVLAHLKGASKTRTSSVVIPSSA
jgi:hypothetical protein